MSYLSTILRLIVIVFTMIISGFVKLTPLQSRIENQSAQTTISSAPCLNPPKNFNLLKTNNEELLQYGIPIRPTNAKLLQIWIKHYNRPLKHICTPFHRGNGNPNIPLGKIRRVNWDRTLYNWSGYDDLLEGSNGIRFEQAQGDFNLNCTSSTSQVWDPNQDKYVTVNDGYVEWVGTGGVYGGTLWQAGWDGVHHTFWFEQVGGSNDTGGQVNFGPSGSSLCGHMAFVEIDQDLTFPSGTYASIIDLNTNETANTYNYKQFRNNYADKETVEWIDERTACGKKLDELGDYNKTYYSNAYFINTQSQIYELGAGDYQKITMIDAIQGNVLSNPVAMGSTTFTDQFIAPAIPEDANGC